MFLMAEPTPAEIAAAQAEAYAARSATTARTTRAILTGIAVIIGITSATLLAVRQIPTSPPPVTTVPTPTTITMPPITSLPPTTTTVPPTTTQPPTPTTVPPGGAFPDASSTGARGTLTPVPGSATTGPGWKWDTRGFVAATTSGAVIENLDVNGAIVVAPIYKDVTVRNNRVVTHGDTFAINFVCDYSTSPSTCADRGIVTRNTVRGASRDVDRCLAGIEMAGNVIGDKITFNDVSWCATGIQLDDGLVTDNYVHDLGWKSSEAAAGREDHINGLTMNGGSNVTVRHNTFLNDRSQTDAVSFFQDFTPVTDILVEDNLLAGGGYTIYGGAGGKGPTKNIVIRNNQISTRYFPLGGYWNWIAYYTATDPGNVLTGNRWADGPKAGQLIAGQT